MTTDYKQRAELAEARVEMLEAAIRRAQVRLGEIRWEQQGVAWEKTPDGQRFDAVYESIVILRDAMK